ncbi:hypothetical protein NEOLEDRAFT_1169502 [Neolentinus lepideus HHB14362 ss-1]|uniref:Phenol 2-monooxygenase n=1 Tax=Neolentinus lepideus HHB14362 ss-1 TaxID=1314782 RepID=A0A165SL04_9AGAM|nr:hypothetical protein NEOLEDRAFT_1169502 [Neolentinus lepideus HHB14362 ss-1]
MPVPLLKESDVDVLVIGAGPAGLMCAQGLARAGVNVRIIDKRPGKVAAGQADGIQPRTIEVLQSYGLAERLLREGNQMHMAAFYDPSPQGGIHRTGRAPDINAPTARYPFEVTLHQGAIEAIFLDCLRSFGKEVERPVVPESIEVTTDPVVLKNPQAHAITVAIKDLDAPGGTEIIHAKYVVGADGAHSWVRKEMGIAMEGEQTDYVWGVVDMIPDTDFPDIRNRCAIHSNNGSCMIIPREGDVVRLYIQLTDQDVRNVTGRVDMGKFNAEKLLEVAKKSFYPYRIKAHGDVQWWTIYIIGQRVAAKFASHERVFIAGDACHTHSPKAGQGMNASMNDTHNLIWKLTHVLRGWADMSLLKTYEFERRKYAQDLIDFDRKFAALFSSKPKSEDNPDGVTQEEFLDAFRAFGAFTSGIGIQYAPSLIVNATHQTVASRLIIGGRILPQSVIRAADARPFELQDLLPSDTRFKILVFTGDIRDASQMEKVNELANKLGREDSFLRKFGKRQDEVYDMFSICSTRKEEVNYTDMPPILRSHWSKVLLDDIDSTGKIGGGVYDKYGIGSEGAIVVIRPDGYVGVVAPLNDVTDLERYFSGFSVKS